MDFMIALAVALTEGSKTPALRGDEPTPLLQQSVLMGCMDALRRTAAQLSAQALAGFLRKGAKPNYSEELGCKAFTAQVKGETRFILFDDRETLCRKAQLAASLGVFGAIDLVK